MGSRARDPAEPGSDVDVIILVQDPESYRRGGEWLEDIPWPPGAEPEPGWADVQYGAVWSRHLLLLDGTPLELSFGPPAWARTDPVDPGTRTVIEAGCRVVWDPEGLLAALVAAVDE